MGSLKAASDAEAGQVVLNQLEGYRGQVRSAFAQLVAVGSEYATLSASIQASGDVDDQNELAARLDAAATEVAAMFDASDAATRAVLDAFIASVNTKRTV